MSPSVERLTRTNLNIYGFNKLILSISTLKICNKSKKNNEIKNTSM